MGNCLKTGETDDVSLLTSSDNQRESVFSESYVERSTTMEAVPVYYPSPSVSRPASQLTEEEQIKIVQRIGMIQHLPIGIYDEHKKIKECVICMGEFLHGDAMRYLPCMHTYHVKCIDDWLMRSFTCPSCMESVDSALLISYESN